MIWLKRIGGGLLLALALLAAVPLFVSVDDYRPRLEHAIATRLGEPVSAVAPSARSFLRQS